MRFEVVEIPEELREQAEEYHHQLIDAIAEHDDELTETYLTDESLVTPEMIKRALRAGTVWAHERNGVAECQTQNYNFPVIRVYEAVGAHYVRAE